MSVTIVLPCFNEEENIESIYERIRSIVEPLFDFEILFVDDGSRDQTLARIKEIRKKDQRIKYISLLCNYGHQAAILAGLHSSFSEYTITMDADHQHPPEIIPELIAKQKSTDSHIVAARRIGSQKGFLKNFFSKSFYSFFQLSTGLELESGISDFRLYTLKSLDLIRRINEQEPFLRGMISRLNLEVAIVDYNLQERKAGTPSYTFRKSFFMAVNALLRYTNFPVKVGILGGVVGMLTSLWFIFHYTYLRLFTDELIPGQADLMVFLGLIGSLVLLQLSILLHMNIKIIDGQSNVPNYVISEKDL